MKTRFTVIIFSLMICFSACEEKLLVDSSPIPAQVSELDREQSKLDFAQILAKALKDVKLRAMLKQESLKKFDKDYDVLYQSVKDYKLSATTSVKQRIALEGGSEEHLDYLTNSNPLLTIYIPEMVTFSAEQWDVEKQVPLVAVRNVRDMRAGKKMIAFDGNGNKFELSYRGIPNVPIIVVKDNERLSLLAPSSKNVRAGVSNVNGHTFLTNDLGRFNFWDDTFDGRIKDNTNSQARDGIAFYSTVDPTIREAYENGAACQRDNMYYQILPQLGRNTGVYQPGYEECLTSLEFGGIQSYDYVVDDVSDGYLEFQVSVFLIGPGGSSITPINKGISCRPQDLWDYHVVQDNGNNRVVVDGTKPYKFYRVPIIGWNVRTYGDTWKFTIQELDPSNISYTTSTGVTSTFGTNFTDNVKDGPSFGNTTTNGYTVSYSYTVTSVSDQLFDGTLAYCSTIIKSTETVNDIPFVGTAVIAHTRTVDTGNAYAMIGVMPFYTN